MFRRLGSIYARRVVNVNINILLAGLLALGPTLLVVRLVEHLLKNGIVSGAKFHLGDHAVISGATLIADLAFDVSIYYLLHWLANHSHKPKRQERLETIAEAAVESVPFFRDATKVQFQRMVLSPLLYSLWIGTQLGLMHIGQFRPVPATVCGFIIAVGSTRTIHTLWLLREQRLSREFALGRTCPGCRNDLRGVPNDDRRTCPKCGKRVVPLKEAVVSVAANQTPQPSPPLTGEDRAAAGEDSRPRATPDRTGSAAHVHSR